MHPTTHTLFYQENHSLSLHPHVKKAVPYSFENRPMPLQREKIQQGFKTVFWSVGTLAHPDLCVFSWALQAAGSEKALWQSLQLKGFSPVWMRMCLLKFPVCVNFFPQSWNRSVAIYILETHIFHLQWRCTWRCFDRTPRVSILDTHLTLVGH